MAEISEAAVRKVLESVIDPATGRSVTALGMVGGIATRGGHVAVTLDVDPARVAVELNRSIIQRGAWGEAIVGAGATLEIVQFVGGG